MSRQPTPTRPKPLVLHVIDSLDISGGAEKQLTRNIAAFDHDLLEHRIAVVKLTETSRVDELRGSVPVDVLVPPETAVTRLTVIKALRRYVIRIKPDLMHCSLPDSSLATRVVAGLNRTPAIESLVNISHEPIRALDNPHVNIAKLRAHTVLDKVTMRSLTGFHAVSEAVAESWTRIVGIPGHRIRVIPRGVDVSQIAVSDADRDEYGRSVRIELGFPEDSFLVLSVGRIEPQKGHRYLVEATARLAKKYTKLRVAIVGREGLASTAVREQIRGLGLSDRVVLTGPRRDLRRLYAASDLFAFPSLFEGNGGNAMIEAMAAGLPIVTTGASPMTDLIPNEDFGALSAPADSIALSSAMAAMIENDALRRRLTKNVLQRVRTFPGHGEVARRFERWYLELVGSA